MPVDPIIQKAEKAAKDLESLVRVLQPGAGEVEKVFKEKIPPEGIDTRIKAFESNIATLKKEIAEAEKVDKEIDPKLKAKVVDPAVKKAGADLDAALKTGREMVTKMEGHAKIFHALLAKERVKYKEDEKWLKEFEPFLAQMKKTGSGLLATVNNLEAHSKALEKTRDFFPANYKTRLTTFEKDVKDLGGEITTADSMLSAYDHKTKDAAKLLDGHAIEGYKKSAAVKTELATDIKKARTSLNGFLADITTFKANLKEMEKKGG